MTCLLELKNTRTLTFENFVTSQLSKNLSSSQAKSILSEDEKKILKPLRDLGVLECVYRYLLGEKIRYQMGVLGPYFDLFLLCVLMNQRVLAFELWKQCLFPDRCAILGVCLLHKCPRSTHAHNQCAIVNARLRNSMQQAIHIF
jgi:hypothetical protein